nr:ORF3 [Escherichia coli]
MSSFQFEQIGVIRSPYKEKFAVPRQPGLVKSQRRTASHCSLQQPTPFAAWKRSAIYGSFSSFIKRWKAAGVRLCVHRASAVTARMGVFATRSTFRPNPIGMSLVELKEVVCHKDSVILKLGSLDLVDGTPVVDIKPYLPFAESLPDASASYRKVRQLQRWR